MKRNSKSTDQKNSISSISLIPPITHAFSTSLNQQTISGFLSNYGVVSNEEQVSKAKTGPVDKCLSLVSNFFFPLRCGGCGANDTLLCEECAGKLVFKNINMCLVCGGPSVQGHTHAQCLTEFSPQKFVTVFSYQPPFSRLLQRVKYKQRAFSYLKPVLEIATLDLKERGFSFGSEAIVVPIPLHFLKRFQRGFNVADIIARELASNFGMRFNNHLLHRVKNTQTQTRLNKDERRQNVNHAFHVYKWNQPQVVGHDILLVDDVCTTGATLLSTCHALKEAGAGQVWCFSLAKD